MARCKGILTGLIGFDDALAAVPKQAAALVLATCEEPVVFGILEHILCVWTRPAQV